MCLFSLFQSKQMAVFHDRFLLFRQHADVSIFMVSSPVQRHTCYSIYPMLRHNDPITDTTHGTFHSTRFPMSIVARYSYLLLTFMGTMHDIHLSCLK